jgi:hypothetical protein
MIQGVKNLARDSKRMKAINLEWLDKKQIEGINKRKFTCVLKLSISSPQSDSNVEKLRTRLDDAILLVSDMQSGGKASKNDIKNVLQDIATALGVVDGQED